MLTSSLHNTDTSLRWTVAACPEGVHLKAPSHERYLQIRWREKLARVNSWRFYCDFANSRKVAISDVLNMFKFHRNIGAIFSITYY